jgi:hypothetical protein
MSGDQVAEIRYADLWKAGYDKPGDVISETEARRRHDAGERYAALLKSGDRRVVVESNLGAGLITVYFLDDKRRWTTKYVFEKLESGELWLQQTGTREWLDDARFRYDTTVIRDDGRMYAERGVQGEGEKDVMEKRLDPASLTFLKEPVPAFGDYRSISRLERDGAPQGTGG